MVGRSACIVVPSTFPEMVALVLLGAGVSGPPPCTVISQTANCATGRILNIPQQLPSNITKLHLKHNLIKSIKSTDLQLYRQLHEVYINHNLVEQVHVKAFANLTELYLVDLSYNKLTRVDNTIFINNTKLAKVMLNGNKLLFEPLSPFLISSSITYLYLQSSGISQVTNVTFSKMEKLRSLNISENSILRLDPGSFYYNSLQTLYIDYEEEIKSTLIALSYENVSVYCKTDDGFFEGDSRKKVKCNLTIPDVSTIIPPQNFTSKSASREEPVIIQDTIASITEVKKEGKFNLTNPNESNISPSKRKYSGSASRGKTDSILVRVESTTEVKKEVIFNLTIPTSLANSPPKEIYSVSASPEETVTIPVKAESTTEMATQSIAMDRALVYVFASFAFISTGLAVIMLVLYLKKRKSKTNGSKPETSPRPENQYILVLRDQVNDGYEVARKDYLVQKQPDVLPVWPSVKAPQRPLPSPPLITSSLNCLHEYEIIRDQ